MKIALTGGNGGIGSAIAVAALAQGHSVVSLDHTPPALASHPNLLQIQGDIVDYDALVRGFEGCEALIHMAAIPAPIGRLDHVVHNTNVVGSYNALRAAAEHGIKRVCQASSVNAIGLSFSRAAHFDYFPIDEAHAKDAKPKLEKMADEMLANPVTEDYEVQVE